MSQSMTGIWVTRIIIALVIIGLGWFFFFSSFSGCYKSNEVIEVKLVRDSSDQKKIDSLQNKITDYKKQIDNLEEANIKLEQKRYENAINTKITKQVIRITPAIKLYPEIREWLSPGRSCDSTNIFSFDSLDVMSMADKKAEYNFLLTDNNLLDSEITNYKARVNAYKLTIGNLYQIIDLKDSQISKLEGTPVQVQVIKRKWYVDAAIITTSVAAGYLLKSILK